MRPQKGIKWSSYECPDTDRIFSISFNMRLRKGFVINRFKEFHNLYAEV
jgi:hypothetical protein